MLVFFPVVFAVISLTCGAPASNISAKYDQRQTGKYNVRADLSDFLIMILPVTQSDSANSTAPSFGQNVNLLDFFKALPFRTRKVEVKHVLSHEDGAGILPNLIPQTTSENEGSQEVDSKSGSSEADKRGEESQGSTVSQGAGSQSIAPQDAESQGEKLQGQETGGQEIENQETQGLETQGQETQGQETQGLETQGQESQGQESQVQTLQFQNINSQESSAEALAAQNAYFEGADDDNSDEEAFDDDEDSIESKTSHDSIDLEQVRRNLAKLRPHNYDGEVMVAKAKSPSVALTKSQLIRKPVGISHEKRQQVRFTRAVYITVPEDNNNRRRKRPRKENKKSSGISRKEMKKKEIEEMMKQKIK